MIHAHCNRGLMAAIALVAMSPAVAHELMLKPPASIPIGSKTAVVELSNGDIDKSVSNTPLTALADLRIVQNGTVVKPSDDDWTIAPLTSHLRIDVRKAGTYLLAASTTPKIFEMSPREFADYIQEEQIEVVASRPTGAKIRERYSKHAISYLQIGSVLTDDYATQLTYPVQIRLGANPSSLRVGDKIRLAVTLHGKPLIGQLLLGGRKGSGQKSNGNPNLDLRMRTDSHGMAELKITQAGRWYVYLVLMHPLNDGSADYESFYATTLFDVND